MHSLHSLQIAGMLPALPQGSLCDCVYKPLRQITTNSELLLSLLSASSAMMLVKFIVGLLALSCFAYAKPALPTLPLIQWVNCSSNVPKPIIQMPNLTLPNPLPPT